MFLSFLLVLLSVGVLAPTTRGSHHSGVHDLDPTITTSHHIDEASDIPSNTLTAPELLRLGVACAEDRSVLLAIASRRVQDLVALKGKTKALQGEHNSLLSEHSVLQTRQADLASEHSSLHRRHQRLARQRTELGREHAALQQAHKALLQQQGELRSAHQSTQEALRNLRAKNGGLSLRLKDMASAWHEERQHAKAVIEKHATETRALFSAESERLQQSEQRRRRSEKMVEELEWENRNLKEKVEYLEKQREENNILYKTEVEKYQDEKKAMKEETEVKVIKLEREKDNLKEKLVLKKTFWYEMSYSGTKTPKPQTEEDITDVKWMNKWDTNVALTNTYPSIIEVIKEVEI